MIRRPTSRHVPLAVVVAVACALGADARAEPKPAEAQAPTTPTESTEPTGDRWPVVQRHLSEVRKRIGPIQSFRATFTQTKQTPLLRKPLVSTGTVVYHRSKALWTTLAPDPSRMLLETNKLCLYFPDENVLEIYGFHGGAKRWLGTLSGLVSSRLDGLEKGFNVQEVLKDEEGHRLTVRLTPRAKETARHIRELTTRLNLQTGAMDRLEMLDGDRQRLVITFQDIKINAPVRPEELRLRVPKNARIIKQQPPNAPRSGSGKASEQETGDRDDATGKRR